MRKPKIRLKVGAGFPRPTWWAEIEVCPGFVLDKNGFMSRRAAREWAKEWCRTVGAALLEKGTTPVRLKQPKCTCDQQGMMPDCPALLAGWAVGEDSVCSVPPKRRGK